MLENLLRVKKKENENKMLPWIVFDSRDIDENGGNRTEFLSPFGRTSIPRVFLESKAAFVVFCSSPTTQRWNLDQHWCKVSEYYMDPFDIQELRQLYVPRPINLLILIYVRCEARHEHSTWSAIDTETTPEATQNDPDELRLNTLQLETRSTDEAEEEFKAWGPFPRCQIQPFPYDLWKEQIQTEIINSKEVEIFEWIKKTRSGRSKSKSMTYNTFVQRRAPGCFGWNTKTIRRIDGTEIERLVQDRMLDFLLIDADGFYAKLQLFCDCRAAAGCFFELRAIAYFHGEPGSRHTIFEIEQTATGKLFRKGHSQLDFTTQTEKGWIPFLANDGLNMRQEVLYVLKARNFVGIDCLFSRGSKLWLFQITEANRLNLLAKTESAIRAVFSNGLPEEVSNWNLIFVTPSDKSDLSLQSSSFKGTFRESGKYQLLLNIPSRYGE